MFRYFLLVLVCSESLLVHAGQNYKYGLKVIESQGNMNQDCRHSNGHSSYQKLWYKSCPLNGYDASGTKLESVHFTHCGGEELNLSNVVFDIGEIQYCSLNNALLVDAILNSVVFDESNATNMNCTNTVFEGCTLRKVKSDGLIFDGTVFRRSHLRDLDWSKADIKSLIIDEQTSIDGLILPFSTLSNISIEGQSHLDIWGVFSYLHEHGVTIVYDKRGDSFSKSKRSFALKFPLKAKEELPESIFTQIKDQNRPQLSGNIKKSELRNRKKRDREECTARRLPDSESALEVEESSFLFTIMPSIFLSCFGGGENLNE